MELFLRTCLISRWSNLRVGLIEYLIFLDLGMCPTFMAPRFELNFGRVRLICKRAVVEINRAAREKIFRYSIKLFGFF